MSNAIRHLGRIWQDRTLHTRRACVAACIASTVVTGSPLNLRAFGDDSPELLMPAAVVHAVAEQDISQPNPPSYVAPAAGVLDNLFGSKPKVAKKESEDGRKATPLPPADPSSVDWNGVPFHQPRRDDTAASEKSQAQPIRDFLKGGGSSNSAVPSSTANLRRQTTSPTTPSSTPSKPVSATNRSVSPSLPPPLPQSRAIPRPSIASSNALGLQTPTQPRQSAAALDISGSTSSRRSERRPVDPLSTESLVESPNDASDLRTEPVLMTPEPTQAPTVQRRELKPADRVAMLPATKTQNDLTLDIPKLPAAQAVLGNVPSNKPDDTTLLPMNDDKSKSLAEEWKSVGSGLGSTTPVVSPPAPTPPAPTSPVAASTPVAPQANAAAPVPPTTAPNPVVSDATPMTANAESEKILRDRLTRELAPVARKPEPSNKQLAASEVPGVRVITEGPSEIMIRELTQYEVRVENRGSVDATGIIVRSSLPAWAEVQGQNASVGSVKAVEQSGAPQLQWTIDKLPAGVVERMFVRVKAVRAGTFDVATDWTMMPQKHTAKVIVREPKLAIVIDGPDEIVFGDSEKYRVRVMNPGDGDAANVVFTLAPDSKAPQSQKIGNIPAGKEAQFEIELTARELGELKIAGMATADREVRTDANKSIRISAATLEAELTGPPLKYQNSEAIYHLFITNTGKAICQGMEAELRLPVGAKYVSGIQQATIQGDRLTWKIDSMQPGAVREYDVNIQLDRTGDLVIGFNCIGSAAGQTSVSIETRVEAIADLVLSISDPAAPAPVKTDVVYEMTITNRGSKAAEDVRIVAQFSDGIEPIKIEGQAGEVLTGQAMFTPIARIEPGSSVRLKVIANANRAGDHRFRAEVRHGETSLVAEEATMFMSAPAERISRRSTDSK